MVAGGGAVEAALSVYLEYLATTLGSREQLAIAEFAESLLIIPKVGDKRSLILFYLIEWQMFVVCLLDYYFCPCPGQVKVLVVHITRVVRASYTNGVKFWFSPYALINRFYNFCPHY